MQLLPPILCYFTHFYTTIHNFQFNAFDYQFSLLLLPPFFFFALQQTDLRRVFLSTPFTNTPFNSSRIAPSSNNNSNNFPLVSTFQWLSIRTESGKPKVSSSHLVQQMRLFVLEYLWRRTGNFWKVFSSRRSSCALRSTACVFAVLLCTSFIFRLFPFLQRSSFSSVQALGNFGRVFDLFARDEWREEKCVLVRRSLVGQQV